MHQSCTIASCWRRDRWIIHASEELIAFIALSSLSIPTMVRSFTQEKSACLAEVGVMEQIMQKSWANIEHVQIVCTRFFFLCPCTRAWEQGYTTVFRHDLTLSAVA